MSFKHRWLKETFSLLNNARVERQKEKKLISEFEVKRNETRNILFRASSAVVGNLRINFLVVVHNAQK